MSRLCTLLSILLLSLGCGDEETATPEPPAAEPEPETPEEVEEESIFDPLGELRESDDTVVGLVLPRGIEPEEGVERDRHHVYFSQVPSGAIRRYFERRLITGNVRESGHAITFYNAVPREARGAVIRVDLSIQPTSGDRTRIDIREHPPSSSQPLSDTQVRERLREVATMWD